MQKTKLGVSVGLLGAALFLGALFGGYVAVFLLAGYILLFEENEWLKKASVKAIAVMIFFGLLAALVGLIPDCIGLVSDFLGIFKVYFSADVVYSIINVIQDVIALIRTVVMLLLGVKALNQGTVAVPVVDNLINKYMG